MTTITLPKDLEDWARAEVAAGRAVNVEALVESRLREVRDVWDAHQPLVAQAWAQMERGEVVDEKDADAVIDALIGASPDGAI
jgi:Arc/MetJ-type ribon-helix-helix transcriptional regulator